MLVLRGMQAGLRNYWLYWVLVVPIGTYGQISYRCQHEGATATSAYGLLATIA